jgi:hypothetical protein
MQVQAAESSGYAGTILLLFEEKSLKTGFFEFLIVKQALEQTPSVCSRAF